MSGAREYPDDAAEMARVIRRADEVTAVRILQVWGLKQRNIGAVKELRSHLGVADAQA